MTRIKISLIPVLLLLSMSVFSQVIFNQPSLERLKSHYQKDSLNPAISALLKSADKELNRKSLYTIVNKKQVPPSGDKHDYMSLAPYWFSDSTQKNGLPYIRRDGVRNPEAVEYTDEKQLNRMCDAVEKLSLAYYFTQNKAYSIKAQRLLQAWFVDSATRMNPNMLYAQAIKGRNDGRGAGILKTRSFIELLDAVELLKANQALDENLYVALKAWFLNYFEWMKQSKNGKDEMQAKNNHGSWYAAQYARYALFLGKNEEAKTTLEGLKARIEWQIEHDGTQPLELVRTKSLSYSLFNLTALCKAALMADKVGVDLWNYQTTDGPSIKKAADYLLPFITQQSFWKGQQITKIKQEELLVLLLMLKSNYPDNSQYIQVLQKINDSDSVCNLIY